MIGRIKFIVDLNFDGTDGCSLKIQEKDACVVKLNEVTIALP